MDAAYDSIETGALHLAGPQADHRVNPRRSVEMQEALKQERGARRSVSRGSSLRRALESERINGRLKDEFGGRHVACAGTIRFSPTHVRHDRLTASQLMRLIVPPI